MPKLRAQTFETAICLPGRHRAQAQLGGKSEYLAAGRDRRYRELLGVCVGAKEDKAGWSSFRSAQIKVRKTLDTSAKLSGQSKVAEPTASPDRS